MRNPGIYIKKIATEEIISIRHKILRQGKPLESCYFQGDNLPTTFHLGLFLDNNLIGVATFLENNRDCSENELQLRGMAVLEEYQGKRYGELILKKGEEIALQNNKKSIWCNARVKARRFYERSGYEAIGEPFNIPEIGEHYVMVKKLE